MPFPPKLSFAITYSPHKLPDYYLAIFSLIEKRFQVSLRLVAAWDTVNVGYMLIQHAGENVFSQVSLKLFSTTQVTSTVRDFNCLSL